MIDAGTALILLDNLFASNDVVYLLDDGDREVRLTELTFDRFFEEDDDANTVRIIYTGGTRHGDARVKRGNLYSMLIDRMTFNWVVGDQVIQG